jgi:hypothetical protein
MINYLFKNNNMKKVSGGAGSLERTSLHINLGYFSPIQRVLCNLTGANGSLKSLAPRFYT